MMGSWDGEKRQVRKTGERVPAGKAGAAPGRGRVLGAIHGATIRADGTSHGAGMQPACPGRRCPALVGGDPPVACTPQAAPQLRQPRLRSEQSTRDPSPTALALPLLHRKTKADSALPPWPPRSSCPGLCGLGLLVPRTQGCFCAPAPHPLQVPTQRSPARAASAQLDLTAPGLACLASVPAPQAPRGRLPWRPPTRTAPPRSQVAPRTSAGSWKGMRPRGSPRTEAQRPRPRQPLRTLGVQQL